MEDNAWQNTETIEIPEEALRQTLENQGPSLKEKSFMLIQRSPFLVAGLATLVAICGVGAYKWRTKTIRPSMYLMQLRVIAQGSALGIITLGMAYDMYKRHVLNKEKE